MSGEGGREPPKEEEAECSLGGSLNGHTFCGWPSSRNMASYIDFA